MDFKDKRVLVTGSSRGIGFAAVKRFLEGGARVVINGRSESTVKEARGALGQSDRVYGVAADMLPKWGRRRICDRRQFIY